MITTQEWRQAGSYFTHRGHRIFWREEGNVNAPALLLIHGFPTASWDYEGIWKELIKNNRLLTLDMIGFGFSDKPTDYDYTQLDQADIYEELLRRRKVDKFHLITHNYGTSVAEELLARDLNGGQRPRLLSACFLNGGLFPEARHKIPMQEQLLSPGGPALAKAVNKGKVGEVFSEILSKQHPPTREFIDAVWELISVNDGIRVWPKILYYLPERLQRRERWVGALLETTVPLKVINGNLDPLSGIREADAFRHNVPNADVTDLTDVGHYPHVEAPERVLRYYFEFRERVAGAADVGGPSLKE